MLLPRIAAYRLTVEICKALATAQLSNLFMTTKDNARPATS